jgi:diacylglycerol kinase family enzyme
MLWSMARLSGGRPRIGRRGATVVHDVGQLTLLADEALPFQVDGEYLDAREKVTFRSVRRAVQVVTSPSGKPE